MKFPNFTKTETQKLNIQFTQNDLLFKQNYQIEEQKNRRMQKNSWKQRTLKPVENRLKIDPNRHSKFGNISSVPQKQSQETFKRTFSNEKGTSKQQVKLKMENTELPELQRAKRRILSLGRKESGRSINKQKSILEQLPLKEEEATGSKQFIKFNESEQVLYPQLKNRVQELLSKMTENMCFAMNGVNITVKKEKLNGLLLAMLESILDKDYIIKGCQINAISNTFTRIKEVFDRYQLSIKSDCLKHCQETVTQTVDPFDLEEQRVNVANNISNLINHEKSLKETLQNIKYQYEHYHKLSISTKEQLESIRQECFQKTEEIKKLSQILEKTEQNIKKAESLLTETEEKAQAIFNHIQTQQAQPFLQEVSKTFRQNERGIYSYAYTIHNDPIYLSPKWQVIPFTEMMKNSKQDFEELIQNISSESLSQEKKESQLKDFLQTQFRKLKLKSDEMDLVIQRKTECIAKYMKMLTQWSYNYELKNGYLKKLRKEFVADSEKVNKLIASFSGLNPSNEQLTWMENLTVSWNWVEKNFKIANSFY